MNQNCFAKNTRNGCRALVIKECLGKDKCNFFKTKEEQQESLENAYARIRTLNETTQLDIAENYYLKSQPWNKKGDI